MYAQRQEAIFSIHPEEIRFNTYFLLSNIYDSASVYYEIGNISFTDNIQQKHWIYLSDSLEKLPQKSFQSSWTVGESQDFFQILRTESFYLPNNYIQIEFFRKSVLNRDPCKAFQNSNSSGGSRGIDDLSKFTVDLVDANTNMVLATIDSVISPPVNNRFEAILLGSETDLTYHKRVVPSNCINRNVYIRFTVLRDGSTPFGMIAKSFKFWTNRASVFDLYGSYVDNPLFFDSVNTLFRNRLINYLDSVELATGSVIVPEFYPPNFGVFFADRYYFKGIYNQMVMSNGDTIKISKNNLLKESIYQKDEEDKLRIIALAPSIVRNLSEVYLKFYNNKSQNLDIFLTNINGDLVLTICKKRDFSKGIQTLNLISRNIPKGLYFLNIIPEDGDSWLTRKIYFVE